MVTGELSQQPKASSQVIQRIWSLLHKFVPDKQKHVYGIEIRLC
jgi:hypothetical protein